MAISVLLEALSKREKEILMMITQGLSNQEIATRSGISITTVKWHIGHILSKLQVNNRIQLLVQLKDTKHFSAHVQRFEWNNVTVTVLRFEALSKREKEILEMITQGLSNQEIADQSEISITTVKWHIKHILSKLHVRSRIQLLIHVKKSVLLDSVSST